MVWTLKEALDHYKRQGAPSDQSALIALLTEIQQEHGGSIPKGILPEVAAEYAVKEALLLAIIKRIPRLRLSDVHTLEVCAGPNCGKSAALVAAAEKLVAAYPGKVILKFTPCMRMCGKGPNIKWDGILHHHTSEAHLQQLAENL